MSAEKRSPILRLRTFKQFPVKLHILNNDSNPDRHAVWLPVPRPALCARADKKLKLDEETRWQIAGEAVEELRRERQLNFESVLGSMGGIVLNNRRQAGNGVQGASIHQHAAKRRFEGVDRRSCYAAHMNIVGRTDEHDARDRLYTTASG